MGTMERRDIETRADIERVVNTFYEHSFKDEVLGPIFIDIAKMDLDVHIPIMCDFWENILFQSRKYPGGMGMVHFHLHSLVPLRYSYFQRWLGHWEHAVDTHFAGERSDLAKSHAAYVAEMFGQRFEELSLQAGVSGTL